MLLFTHTPHPFPLILPAYIENLGLFNFVKYQKKNSFWKWGPLHFKFFLTNNKTHFCPESYYITNILV